MAIYSLAVAGSVGTTTAPSIDIKASSTNSPRLMELGFINGATTQCTWGIGRPGNDGSVAQTSPIVVLPENPADPTGQTGTAVAWGTAPTVPTQYLRRAYLPATIAAGIIFTFPRGLVLPQTKGIVVWNIAASSATYQMWCVVDE